VASHNPVVGVEAISIARERRPDLMVLDLEIAIMRGAARRPRGPGETARTPGPTEGVLVWRPTGRLGSPSTSSGDRRAGTHPVDQRLGVEGRAGGIVRSGSCGRLGV
jgi:hypothetical protein